MKFIITEEQEKNLKLYRIYELSKPYFEEKGYNNLEKVIKNDNVYYINKNRHAIFYYKQDRKTGNVYISYDEGWAFFDSYFSLKYTEAQEIMRYWLDDFYKLKGLTPVLAQEELLPKLDEAYKLKGLNVYR